MLSGELYSFFTLGHVLRLLISGDCFIWFPYIFKVTSSLSVTDKNKESEHLEGQSEGNGLLPVDSAPVEFENQDMTDVEEMKMKSSDEVCAV